MYKGQEILIVNLRKTCPSLSIKSFFPLTYWIWAFLVFPKERVHGETREAVN